MYQYHLLSDILKSQASTEVQRHPENKSHSDVSYTKVTGKEHACPHLNITPSDPECFPFAHDESLPTYFRTTTTVVSQEGGKDLQPLSFESGEILHFRFKLMLENPGDEARYLFHPRNDPSVYGWVFVKDVEPIHDLVE